MTKKRLDLILLERFPDTTRMIMQSLIMQGKVRVEGQIVTKPGTAVADDVAIDVDFTQPKYVSRAGFKLERALEEFKIDVTGLTVLDAGISTGGFTDCLLAHGAKRVYGIDVGYAQVHEKVRNDSRVILLERTNLRTLEVDTIGEHVDLITLDLSFISVLKVMDAVVNLLKPHGQLIVLIKPQFEAGKQHVGPRGIIKDPLVHARVVDEVSRGIERHGFVRRGLIESPILGSTGNKEFLAWFMYKT